MLLPYELMSKRKRPKNRYCVNSKLTEEEFARISWGFVHGWTTVATRERLLNNAELPGNPGQKITATERTIWTYYRRIGLYLFEKVRDRLIEEVRLVKGIPEKYAHSPEAIFEYVFDAAMDELTHEEYWALFQLRVRVPTDYLLSGLRVMSARKRGIPRSKVEHVALAYYIHLCYDELLKRKTGDQKVEDDELFNAAQAGLLETFLRDPLGGRDKLARNLSRRAADQAAHPPWLVGELPTHELRMQEAELQQARQRWDLPPQFTIAEVEAIYLRRLDRVHKTKVEQHNRDYELLLKAASR